MASKSSCGAGERVRELFFTPGRNERDRIARAARTMELAAAGSETFIRVGQCGAVQPDIAVGTLVIHEAAVRLVGSIDAYCEPSFPAVANRDVTFALIEACEQLAFPYVVGITASTDSFFAGQDNAFPVPLELPAKVPFAEKMRNYGVATFEMEAAALFVLGSLLKRAAAADERRFRLARGQDADDESRRILPPS
jgi:uridine phosphorylase